MGLTGTQINSLFTAVRQIQQSLNASCNDANSDVEWSLLCDDQGDGNVTEFYRRVITLFDSSGVVTSTTVTDYQLDKTTLYTTTGTVVACSETACDATDPLGTITDWDTLTG